jgi:hypothetical protein
MPKIFTAALSVKRHGASRSHQTERGRAANEKELSTHVAIQESGD